MGIVLVFSLLVTTEFLEVNCFITVVTTKLFAACDPFFALWSLERMSMHGQYGLTLNGV